MKTANSMWNETAIPRKERSKLKGKSVVDVAIIGGGFTGLTTAYYLNKLGLQSAIIEEHHVGWGASSRNAGMLTTGYKNSIIKLSKKYGVKKAHNLMNMSVDCIKLIDEITTEHNINCSMNYSGGLKLAYKASDFENLKKEHEFMLKNFNYTTKIIEPNQLKQEINSPFYKHGGLLDPHSYSFHPFNYAIGLSDIIEQKGSKIYENSKAISIEKKRNKYIVKSESGKIEAKYIVIATNGYTTKLTKKLYKTIIPMESHAIATEPISKKISQELIPKNRVAIDTKNYLYYFRLTPDNRMLFGGRVNISNKSKKNKTKNKYDILQKNMSEVFPDLINTKIDYNWSGMTGFTLDFMPHIGETKDGLFFALGFCGHGAAMSTLFGKIIAHNIFKKTNKKEVIETLPLKTIPFHSQHKKALSLIEHYLKFSDNNL